MPLETNMLMNIKEDYSNSEQILQIAKIKIDFVCAPFHDLGLLTATYIAKTLNLPGYDDLNTTKNLIFKNRFKKIRK